MEINDISCHGANFRLIAKNGFHDEHGHIINKIFDPIVAHCFEYVSPLDPRRYYRPKSDRQDVINQAQEMISHPGIEKTTGLTIRVTNFLTSRVEFLLVYHADCGRFAVKEFPETDLVD